MRDDRRHDEAPDRFYAAAEFAADPETSIDDNSLAELLDLVRVGDRAGFQALASALMPLEDVEPSWAGARARMLPGHDVPLRGSP